MLCDGVSLATQVACKESTTVSTDAVGVLSQQYFFTSNKLAKLATEAELLTKVSFELLSGILRFFLDFIPCMQ